jgi:hypothetical protein
MVYPQALQIVLIVLRAQHLQHWQGLMHLCVLLA